MRNPFALFGYLGSESFCDREDETKAVIEAMQAGRNLTLFAIRRLGKSGLIYHVFEKLPGKQYLPVYIDAMASRSEAEFIGSFITAITKELAIDNKGQNFIRKLIDFFSRVRPRVAFDPVTGLPSIELDLRTREDIKLSLEAVFRLLEEESKQVVIAIDEFQHINSYEDSQVARLLRSYMQAYPDIRFIFSGSQRHILMPMFSDAGSPLYRSTQLMQLGKISGEAYTRFIRKHFQEAGKEFEEGVIKEILRWTRRHTYYSQYVCNRLYSKSIERISLDDLEQLKYEILEENKPLFYQFRNLLPAKQWDLLMAIAREEGIDQPLSKDFIQNHHLGTPSTVQGALEALIRKDMIFENFDAEEVRYEVYDVFLSRWLER